MQALVKFDRGTVPNAGKVEVETFLSLYSQRLMTLRERRHKANITESPRKKRHRKEYLMGANRENGEILCKLPTASLGDLVGTVCCQLRGF